MVEDAAAMDSRASERTDSVIATATRLTSRRGIRWVRPVVAAALLAGCAAGVPGAGDREPSAAAKLDVVFVPTAPAVVTAMLELAGVGPDDVVYDLGCGDGRIVIAAAREFGARGVGVDLDPQRVREARAHADRAGVGDRVTFRVEDVFETDIRNATVVTLFLSPELNARLRPKLVGELRPGTRIVSHRYGIADWAPERTVPAAAARHLGAARNPSSRRCCSRPVSFDNSSSRSLPAQTDRKEEQQTR